MNRICIIALSLLLLASCGNRRPGTNQDETAAKPERQGASVDTFAADYRPPAGIKYQPKIVTAGAKTIDVAAALKNVRALKANEWGTPVLHGTGVEAHLVENALLKADGEWVMQAAEGMYLLDDKYKAVKQLFRNDITIEPMGKGHYFLNAKRVLGTAGYDDSLRQIRALYVAREGKKTGGFVAALPWDELRASADTCTPDRLVSLLPLQKGGVYVMDGGYFSPERFSSRLYTFGTRGDTLCLFTLNDAEDYPPAGTYRNAETSGNVYAYGGKPRIRIGFDDTVYELEDASTLKAVWRLDFGALKRPTGKYVVGSTSNDLTGYWLIDSFLETDRRILIGITEGHDCPLNREANAVKLYTIVYDKQTGECFSLPLAKDKKGHPIFPEIPFTIGGKSFSAQRMGATDSLLYFSFEGKKLKEQLPGVPEVEAFGDEETVIMVVE